MFDARFINENRSLDMLDKSYLFSDDEMRDFIVNGYCVLNVDLSQTLHDTIYDKTKSIIDVCPAAGRVPQLQWGPNIVSLTMLHCNAFVLASSM